MNTPTRAVGILTAIIATATLHAQRPATPQPDSLPRELVEALVRPAFFGYGGGTEFVVGRIPPALAPFLYVPKGARILGGMTGINGTTGVVVAQGNVESISEEYRRELPKLGWTAPPPTGRSWGFIPANESNSTGNGLEFCHIGQSLQVIPVPVGNNTVQVTATVQNGGRCNNSVTFMGGRAQPPGAVALPVLVNPLGTATNAVDCNTATMFLSGSNGSSERVKSQLSIDQLLERFAKQLADSGWKGGAATTVQRRVWTAPDTGATVRELTLTATPMPVAGCEDLSMTVRLVPKR